MGEIALIGMLFITVALIFYSGIYTSHARYNCDKAFNELLTKIILSRLKMHREMIRHKLGDKNA